MRPHNPVVRSKAQALARAKLKFKDSLWWIRGFPSRVPKQNSLNWHVVSGSLPSKDFKTIPLKREDLRKATYGSRYLVSRFPRALPKIVGDANSWYTRVLNLLKIIKGHIHDNQELPKLDALLDLSDYKEGDKKKCLRLKKKSVCLEPLLEALVWIHFINPKEIQLPLTLIEENLAYLETTINSLEPSSCLTLLLNLCDLTLKEGHSRNVRYLVKFIGDARIYSTPLYCPKDSEFLQPLRHQLNSLLQQHDVQGLEFKIPNDDFTSDLINWVKHLFQQDLKTRKKSLELFNTLCPLSIVDECHPWWIQLRSVIQQTKKLVFASIHNRVDKKVKELKIQLVELERSKPTSFDKLSIFFKDLDSAVQHWPRTTLQNCQQILELLPENAGRIPARYMAFKRWRNHASKKMEAKIHLEPWLRSLKPLLKDPEQHLQFLNLWIKDLKDRYSNFLPETRYLNGSVKKHLYFNYFEFTKSYLSNHELSNEEISDFFKYQELVLELLKCLKTTEEVKKIYHYLSKKGVLSDADGLYYKELRLIVSIAEGQPQRVEELIQRFKDQDLEVEDTEGLISLFQIIDSPLICEEILLQENIPHIVNISKRLKLLKRLTLPTESKSIPKFLPIKRKLSREEQKETERWIKRYPPRLHTVLMQLARTQPDAKELAARTLSRSYPDPAQIKREMEALKEKIDLTPGNHQGSLLIRLKNLEHRLESKKSLSDRKLANHRKKLRKLISSCRLKAWDSNIKRALSKTLAEKTKSNQTKKWLQDPQILTLLTSYSDLPSKFIDLGLSIIECRGGKPPWDFRNHTANKSFIHKMEKRGIHMKPWVDGISTLEQQECLNLEADTESPQEQYSLFWGLENDPFEALLMGEHFKSCLSLHDFNFYSAISNTVDINKRVLYARDSMGKVQGRCLLALNNEGEILTFYTYCHDRRVKINSGATTFVTELASKMNTTLTTEGKVANLVAPSWYDDGSYDVTQKFAFLNEGSNFRKSIENVNRHQFLKILNEELGEEGIQQNNISKILDLNELDHHPDWIEAICPSIENMPRLNFDVLLRTAILLKRAGIKSKARHFFFLAARKILNQKSRRTRHYLLSPDLLNEILESHDYAFVLKLLRNTRIQKLRKWEQEKGWRLEYSARAHEGLKRLKVASKLYKKLLPTLSDSIQQQECSDRIEKIEQELVLP